jgi:hypothetical protein
MTRSDVPNRTPPTDRLPVSSTSGNDRSSGSKTSWESRSRIIEAAKVDSSAAIGGAFARGRTAARSIRKPTTPVTTSTPRMTTGSGW